MPEAATSTSELLTLIRTGRATTRSALIAATGLSRSTILQRVNLLIESGLVREGAPESLPSGAGRPPASLSFNEQAGVVLGADIGASHGRLAVANLNGVPIAETSERLEIGRGPQPVLDWLVERFGELLDHPAVKSRDVLAVGVGVPGRVDARQDPPVPLLRGWGGSALLERLHGAFAAPVLVDNDVHVMAIGEHRGSERDLDPLLFVKLGTGIGAALVVDGAVYHGLNGAAGHIGHMRAPVPSDVQCRCGKRGCLNALVSGAALAQALSAAGLEAATTDDVVRHVADGSFEAFQLVREAGRTLGEALAMIVSMLAPKAIVLGGELAGAHEPLLAGVREVVYQRAEPISTGELEIVPSRVGPRAGVTGAVAMAVEHVVAPASLARLVKERAA